LSPQNQQRRGPLRREKKWSEEEKAG